MFQIKYLIKNSSFKNNLPREWLEQSRWTATYFPIISLPTLSKPPKAITQRELFLTMISGADEGSSNKLQ